MACIILGLVFHSNNYVKAKYVMRHVELIEARTLTESRRYEEMFNPIKPLLTGELQYMMTDEIKWAKTVLKRQDRIVWYLRIVRNVMMEKIVSNWPYHLNDISHKTMDDLDRDKAMYSKMAQQVTAFNQAMFDGRSSEKAFGNVKNTLEHFVAIPCPAIQNYVFDRQSVATLGNQLRELENEWQKDRDQEVDHEEGFEIVIQFPDGFAWVNLGRHACDAEAGAMGHCGNRFGNRSDRMLSLRKRINETTWRPSLTFIINDKGYLGEMKGRANEKPAARYHPYIIALLESPMVKGIVGGGYEPENNFDLSDLTDEQRDLLFKKKPALMPPLEYLERIGMDEHFREMVSSRIDTHLETGVPGWKQEGDGWRYVVEEAEDWLEIMRSFVGHKGNILIDQLEGEYHHDYSDTDISDVIGKFPTALVKSIRFYVLQEVPDELRDYVEDNSLIDEGEDLSEIEDRYLWEFIQEEEIPNELYAALRSADYFAQVQGTANALYKAVERAKTNLENLKIDSGSDGLYQLYLTPEAAARMSAQEEIDSDWNETIIEIEIPYYGFRDYDEEVALDSFLEECPDDIKLEVPNLPPVENMGWEELRAEYGQEVGVADEDLDEYLKRYGFSPDDLPRLRTTVIRARKRAYGRSVNPQTA